MFIQDGTKLTLAKGDTACLDFELDNYSFSTGDKVIFTIAKLGTIYLTKTIDTFIITNYEKKIARILIQSEDTHEMNPDEYSYDILCKLTDGTTDTVIISEFVLLEVAHEQLY